MAPSRAQKDDIVQMGGKTLKRVMDNETRQWVYRPVDESSGKVISKEAFEAMKREEAKARWESDPKRQAEQDKKWAAQQRSEIRGARIADAKQMKKNEHVRKLKSGLVEPSRPRRREIASVAVPKILADLREEMRVAAANGMDKRNPGQFAFIKTALDAEEAKHDAAVKAARTKAYAKERKKRGVRGAAWGSSDEGEDASDDEDSIPRRGSLADLDDPDYRRGPAPVGPPGGASAGGERATVRDVMAGGRTADGNDGAGAKGKKKKPPARQKGKDAPTGDANDANDGGERGSKAVPKPEGVPAPRPAGANGRGVDELSEKMAGASVGDGGGRGRGRGRGRGGGRGDGGRGGRGGRGAPSQPLFDPNA